MESLEFGYSGSYRSSKVLCPSCQLSCLLAPGLSLKMFYCRADQPPAVPSSPLILSD